jgi:hypothetical protein
MFPESRRPSRTGESEKHRLVNGGVYHAVAKNLGTRNCLALLELRRDLVFWLLGLDSNQQPSG